MNDGIQTKLKHLKTLVKKLEATSQELKNLIEGATIEDVLFIKEMASRHRQTAYGTFEVLEETADNRAKEILK